jgi:Spy/CpxP family protein refolding chaperone
MNTQDDTSTTISAPPARAKRRWVALAAALAVAAGSAGASASATGGWSMHGHHGRAGHMSMDPAALDAHIDKMVDKLAADASADQKARVAAIARTALADLRPIHEQFRQGHARAHELLMAPVIDRAALEQLRALEMQRMDLMSRRILAAVEDAADVLTPEQREKFAAHLRSRMH